MFVYYLSILSAYIVNKPEKIYFYYHYKPYGKWWDRLSEQIPIISFEKVELPDKIGSKNIKHYAHKADWIRMNKLYERGGVYMDIDTITCKPYHKYRSYSTVLGYEIKSKDLICNAVMMTIPKSPFFKLWLERYEEEFKEDGWGEASIRLPGKINKNYPYLANVLSENTFFRPYATEGEKIFSENMTINSDLITLHLWESYTMKYMEDIKDFEWIKQNKETLYSKIVLSNISESDI
jgi:mannosyltransferase OCH1-like enzyme